MCANFSCFELHICLLCGYNFRHSVCQSYCTNSSPKLTCWLWCAHIASSLSTNAAMRLILLTSHTLRAAAVYRWRGLHSSLPCRDRANPLEEAGEATLYQKLDLPPPPPFFIFFCCENMTKLGVSLNSQRCLQPPSLFHTTKHDLPLYPCYHRCSDLVFL